MQRFFHRSNKTREDNSPLLLVLVTELFTVALLLLPTPAPHLRTTHKSEEQHTPVQLTDQEHTQPSQDLKEVVRAGNQAEAEARRNATLGSTRATETAQDIVCVQVGQLTKDEDRETEVHEGFVGSVCSGSGVRAEDPVGDVETSQDPVVGAVLDDVAGGHGSAAKAVHEDGLKLALEEVHAQQSADQELGVGGGGDLVEVEVQEGSKGEEEESCLLYTSDAADEMD